MYGSLGVAQHRGPQIDFFHHSGSVVYRDHIVDANLILDQQEESADHVADQVLGAESDGESDDAGAREERPDIVAELPQSGHHREGVDHHR